MDTPPGPGGAGEPALLIYDGDCPLCRRTVRWLRNRPGARNLRWEPSQGDEGRRLVREFGLAGQSRETVLLIDADGVHGRSEAVRIALARLGGIWPAVAKVLRAVPRSWRDRVYDLVSRRRFRL
jgi:predicted DCC family thiol-disulfide oxidoreductase YuxK